MTECLSQTYWVKKVIQNFTGIVMGISVGTMNSSDIE